MIDTNNLRTASLYINNQLLSRGLLRDGENIDFARPGKSEADLAATMGRIMSIVNDLILRRDRDAEYRETLATTMRSLRTESLKSTTEIAKLKEKHAEAKRRVDLAEASEASLKTQLKSADASVKGLKDDLARTKALVAQARASCATEVRRRDRQIDTLKKQVGEAGRARGSRGSPAVTTISVTGAVGAEKSSPRTTNTSSDEYSLRNETNAFLANLAQNLGEENETLLRTMRRAIEHLREMSGWEDASADDGLVERQPGVEDTSADLQSVLDHIKTILTNPSFVPLNEVIVREEEIKHLRDGWVKMETRWNEAVHLIDGWRKRMAASGRPIGDDELKMSLMLSPVRVKDVEETHQAHGLALSAVAEEEEEEEEVDDEIGTEEEDEEEEHSVQTSPCPSGQEEVDLLPVSEDEDMVDESSDYPINEEQLVEDDQISSLEQSAAKLKLQPSPPSSPLPEPPQLSPLRNSSSAANRGSQTTMERRPKPGDITAVKEGKTWELGQNVAQRASPSRSRSSSPRKPSAALGDESRGMTQSPSRKTSRESQFSEPEQQQQHGRHTVDANASGSSEKDAEPLSTTSSLSTPRRANPRLPKPRDQAPPQSPLTMAHIAAKLAASERQADAARVRAKLKAARGTRGVERPPAASPKRVEAERPAAPEVIVDVDPVKHDPAPKLDKRKRDRKTTRTSSRRRSTLSPWELDSIISGKVQ